MVNCWLIKYKSVNVRIVIFFVLSIWVSYKLINHLLGIWASGQIIIIIIGIIAGTLLLVLIEYDLYSAGSLWIPHAVLGIIVNYVLDFEP